MPVELMRKEVELIKKPIQLNEMTRQETVQTVKERDLIVPDGKPDMQRVMYLDGNMSIDQVDVQDDRVVYKGQVDVTILYLPEKSGEEVYSMRGSIPLEDFIIIEGIDPSQKVELDYNIEHMHWNILNERKINVKSIIQVRVASTKPKETVIVTGTEGLNSAQTRTKAIDIVQPAKTGQDNIMVKDELTIMQGKDSIGEILKMNTSIKEEQIKRTDTEILYNGIIELNTLYKGQSDERPLQVITHRIPFSGALDVIKDDDEMYWNCDLEVKPTFVQIQPDFDGEDRIIEIECMIGSKYNTFNKLVEEVVDDIYCPGKKIEMVNKDEDYMNLVVRGNTRMPKKEVMSLTGAAPEADQIFSVKLTPVIDEKEVQNDKLTIRGMMETKVIYLGNEEGGQVEEAIDMLPFVQEIALPGVTKTNYIETDVRAKDINVSPYNKTDILVEYVLECVADVYRKDQLHTITGIEAKDMVKEEMNAYPSITVYVVRKGDTLWDIAKRFNTTVGDIAEINELDVAENVSPLQKLIVLKKTKF
ncbi:MAG: DUF3794 and LysM peptidoglycan-binding domain-containing protein [Cellulosilyticaceae bacterium]